MLAAPDSTFDLVVPGDTAAYYRAIVLAGPDTPPLPQELVDLMKSLPSDDLISGGPATVAAGEENFIAMSSALFVEPGHPVVPAPPALEGVALAASPTSETRLSYDLGHSAFPDVARAGDAVHVVWQERRAGRAEVYYRRSADGGATWEPARRIATGSGDAEMPRVAAVGEPRGGGVGGLAREPQRARVRRLRAAQRRRRRDVLGRRAAQRRHAAPGRRERS